MSLKYPFLNISFCMQRNFFDKRIIKKKEQKRQQDRINISISEKKNLKNIQINHNHLNNIFIELSSQSVINEPV
jgi:hypothetical protein